LFSYLLGEELPGHGTNYLKQTMQFEDQARIDELLTARVIVNRLRPEKALVNLETICTGEGGRLICRGEALVLFQH
jgi:acyl-CoA thioesterase FadM